MVDLDIQNSNLLFLDTSLPFFAIGISKKGKKIYEFNSLNGSHSVRLEERIKDFLKKNDMELSDFDYFMYNEGPGSFTGLRIGASFLNGLALSMGKHLISISIWDLFQNDNIIHDNEIYIRNAKKREFYAYDNKKNKFYLLKYDELLKKNFTILYDGNLSYDFKYKEFHLTPDYFLKNIKYAKIRKKGELKLLYINLPDIR